MFVFEKLMSSKSQLTQKSGLCCGFHSRKAPTTQIVNFRSNVDRYPNVMACDQEVERDNGLYYLSQMMKLPVIRMIGVPFHFFNDDDVELIKNYHKEKIPKIFYCEKCASFDRSFASLDEEIYRLEEIPVSCRFIITQSDVTQLVSIGHAPSNLIFHSVDFLRDVSTYLLPNIAFKIDDNHHFSAAICQFPILSCGENCKKKKIHPVVNVANGRKGYHSKGENPELRYSNGATLFMRKREKILDCFIQSDRKKKDEIDQIAIDFYNDPLKKLDGVDLLNRNHLLITATKMVIESGIEKTMKLIGEKIGDEIPFREEIFQLIQSETQLIPKNLFQRGTLVETFLMPSLATMEIASESLSTVMKALNELQYSTADQLIRVSDRIYDNKISLLDVTMQSRVVAKFFDQLDSAKHEYHVGMIINQLRKIIPHFMFTYDYITCPTNEGFCHQKGVDSTLLLLEFVNGVKLEEIIKEEKPKDEVIYSILCQVIISLIIANDEIGFNHGDLYSKNIIVKQLNELVEINYILYGKQYRLITDRLATIIDYGHSVLNPKVADRFDEPFKSHAQYVIDYNQNRMHSDISLFFPYRDLYSLIVSVGGFVDPEITEWFFKQSGFDDEKLQLRKKLSPKEKHEHIAEWIEKEATDILSPQMDNDYRYLNVDKLVNGGGVIKMKDDKIFHIPNIYAFLTKLYERYDTLMTKKKVEKRFIFSYPIH